MSRRDLIDPEVREPLDQLLQVIPGGFNSIPDIVQRRAAVTQLLAALEIPPNLNVTSEDRMVPGPDGAPDIKVRIYRPAEATGTLGAVRRDVDEALGGQQHDGFPDRRDADAEPVGEFRILDDRARSQPSGHDLLAQVPHDGLGASQRKGVRHQIASTAALSPRRSRSPAEADKQDFSRRPGCARRHSPCRRSAYQSS